MTRERDQLGRGPFRAEHLPDGAPYELSNGHAVLCLPTGARGGRASVVGGSVLASDPAVEEAGSDVGFSRGPGDLRAPDLAVGNIPDAPGWVQGVPALAVEYADRGQDEAELQAKLAELLEAGTRLIWVVRLQGPRRVEIHEPGVAPRVVGSDAVLEAPGILKNPVPVAALYDREAAHEATLRNLLQRAGYADLDAVRHEGREEGREEGLRRLVRRQLERRFGALDDAAVRVLAGASAAELESYGDRLLGATSLADVFAAESRSDQDASRGR